MSLNKIIIGFIIVLLIFSGIIVLQINKNPAPKSKVVIDNHFFDVEVASTSAQQQLGLSGRDSLAQERGMLFVFKKPGYYPFWMKGMKFPLDIIFINNNKIVSIEQNAPLTSGSDEKNFPIYTPDAPAIEALEVNGGITKGYGIQKGDDVKIMLNP